MKALTAVLTLCAALTASGAAQAALESRLGGLALYDTDLNITWASNANLADTNSFGLTYGYNYGNDGSGWPSIINSNGTMTWGGAQKWIAAMNAANYLGYNDWRLPTTAQPDASCSGQYVGISAGYNCTGSELGHLFYGELGGVAGQDLAATHNANYGLFHDIQSPFSPSSFSIYTNSYYWSGTEFAPTTSRVWRFGFGYGTQDVEYKNGTFFALAVRSGQVAAVPVPAAAWLLGSGLLSLVGVARRKAA